MSNKITGIVTKEQLVPCQVTYTGNNYSAITHKQVIETIGEYLYKNNFRPKGEIYLAGSNGQRAIGRIGFDIGEDIECGYELSWKNSLDGSMSFGICSGMKTFICSNGSIYGDISAYKRKHSGNANEEILFQIEKAISLIDETVKIHTERKRLMKEKEITHRTVAELIGRLHIEENIISSTQLGIIKKELENPSYNYCCNGSVWEFYQHCTHAIKETAPLTWHKVHTNLGNWMVNEFGLLVEKKELELV
jgi:hypothetical protein